jgi:HlyD family secretion protein
LAILVIISAIIITNKLNTLDKNIIVVKSSKAEVSDISSYLSTTAEIQSNYFKTYYPPINGTVTEINIKVGDEVKAGQILIKYDMEDLDSTVALNQIQYDNAVLAKQDLVDQNNDTQTKIDDYNSNIKDIGKQIEDLNLELEELSTTNENNLNDVNIYLKNQEVNTLETAKSSLENQRDAVYFVSDSKLKQADNTIASAKINLDSAKEKRATYESSLFAEREGIITALYSVVGAQDNVSKAALEIMDTSDLKAIVYVNKYEADNVQLGDKAKIYSGSNEYDGEVTFIAPNAEKIQGTTGNTASLKVEVKILNADENLKINFEADIDILTASNESVITVPVEAIKTDKDGRNYLYVIENNTAVEKDIFLGIQSDTTAEIVSGVLDQEEVILNPSTEIIDGTIVSTDETAKKGSFFSNMRKSSNSGTANTVN